MNLKINLPPKTAIKPPPTLQELTPSLGRVNLQYVKLAEMNPAPYNPREISDKAKKGLSTSIADFGLVQPIVWNNVTGNIVGGHQRYNDLKAKGVIGTDAVVVSLTLDKEKKLNMVLNNKHIEGTFTQGALDILREIEEMDGLENYVSLQLDGLEAEIAKSFNIKPGEPTFVDGDAADMGIGLGSPSPENNNPEQSHVKQVQLFLSTDTYPLFMEMIEHLKKRYMTDNPTDTVMEALKAVIDS